MEININLININALEWFFIDSSYWLMQMLTNEPYCIVIPWKYKTMYNIKM